MVKKDSLADYRLIIFSNHFYGSQPFGFRKAIMALVKEVEVIYVVFPKMGLFKFLFNGAIYQRIKKIRENNQKISNHLKLFSFWKLIPYSRHKGINRLNQGLRALVFKWIISSWPRKKNIVWFLNQDYYPLVSHFNEAISIFDALDSKNRRFLGWQEKLLFESRLIFFIFEKKKQKACSWVKYPANTMMATKIKLVFRSLKRILRKKAGADETS